MRCLSSKDWANQHETQRNLYIGYTRPLMEYASPGWNGLISPTQRERLQKIQNQACRAIGSLAKTCPVDFLHLETGIEPIASRLEKNDEILWDRYARLPESDSRRQLLDRDVPARLKTRPGWRNMTAPRMRVWSNVRRDTTTPPLPPWETYPNLTFDRVPLEKKKEEYTREELHELALNKLSEVVTPIRIYTDGSTQDEQKLGGAGVYVEDELGNSIFEASYPAGELCSSYSGEGVAAVRALEWLSSNPADATLCTDSLSLHQAMEANQWKDPDPWIKELKTLIRNLPCNITILWLPSHCRVNGNDRADDLAKLGALMQQDEIPVTHKIIKAKIRKRKWQVEHTRACDTYKDRRQPRVEIESRWPPEVRRLYGRLRTGHAKELRHYQYLIGVEGVEDPSCTCSAKRQTIEHILTECPDLKEERKKHFPGGKVKMHSMVLDPEKCRKFLSAKFNGLKISTDTNQNTTEVDTEGVVPPTSSTSQ